ncbi:MAG: GNAT family N-acetyltransferase [Lachnospiraceae bacterium]|nr:GNAT family N-acetyltransferase [Lachnospiraceae bacterium]
MRLKLITKDNLRDVQDMLPDVFTDRKELLGTVCIDETGEEDMVLGISVVFPNEEEGVLEIQWMYVQPEHRRKGAGSCMLNGIRDMAKAAGLKLIDVCFWGEDTEKEEADTWTVDPATENDDRWDESGDIPESEYTETGILKHFLLERGFLTRSEYPIYSFMLKDILTSDYVRGHQKNKNSKVMEAYEGISWGDLSTSMKESVRENVIQAGFTDFTFLSSPDISFVCVKDEKIVGCLLASDNPAEKMITVMLLINFTQDPVCPAKLIAVTGDRILSRYPEDYRVSFIAMNENTLKLLSTILDDRDRIILDGYTVRGIMEA